MDWTRAIERNSEALKGIVEVLFAMLGLACRQRHGGADSAAPPQRRAALAPARRIRRAAACGHRGAGPGGEVCAIASDADGANNREWRAFSSLLSTVRSAQKLRVPAPRNARADAAAHPCLRERSPGDGPVANAPARGRSPSAARWPRQCGAP